MNQRLCLFFAGYCAHAPALYYSQLGWLNDLSASEELQVKNLVARAYEDLAEARYEPESNIRTALSIASYFDISALGEPTGPQDYFEWRDHYTGAFENQFPMSRIDHYYFLYARKLSEVICNIGFAQRLISIKKELPETEGIDRKISKSLKDTEYILFKLIAAAALLSSEPRQSCFNLYYKNLSREFEKFTGIDHVAMDQSQLDELTSGLGEYNDAVKDGIMKCTCVLRDLGV